LTVPDGSIPRPRFFLPVKALSRRFRRKFCAGLCELFEQDQAPVPWLAQQLASPDAFIQFLGELTRKDWVVYAKPPFGGAEHVLNYLARYTPSRGHLQPSARGF